MCDRHCDDDVHRRKAKAFTVTGVRQQRPPAPEVKGEPLVLLQAFIKANDDTHHEKELLIQRGRELLIACMSKAIANMDLKELPKQTYNSSSEFDNASKCAIVRLTLHVVWFETNGFLTSTTWWIL